MNLIYFTSGQVLHDEEIRRQTLRIPEVLTSLKNEQSRFEFDVVACVAVEEEFCKLSDEIQDELVKYMQHGLFARFCRLRIPYSDILYRNQFPTAAALVNQMRWLCRTGEIGKIFVIGPGLDEIPLMLKSPAPLFIDTISYDPELKWFWSAIKKIANA